MTLTIGQCHICGCHENIELLDARDDGTGQFELIECIACYGPGWLPTGGVEISESLCLDLQPFYAVFRVEDQGRATVRDLQTGRAS
jgi:hypothetical protein